MSTVNALRSIKNSLTDPYKNLRNWNKGDPCKANWTGVICHILTPTDGYLHITELYDFCLRHKFLPEYLSPCNSSFFMFLKMVYL